MSALRTELRRSPALVCLPALLGLGVYAAWRTMSPWVKAWPDASGAIVFSVIFLGPLSASIAAWAAGRDHRRGTDYLHVLADRPRFAGPAVSLAALTVWSTVAYVSVVVAVAVRMVAGSGWGRPDVLWILVGALGLAVHCVIGFVAGRAVPKVFTPPIVAVVLYVIEMYASASASPHAWWAYLAPAVEIQRTVFDEGAPRFYAGQGLWYAGIIAAALTVWAVASSSSWQPFAIAGLGSAIVAAIAGGALVGTGDPYGANASFRYVCAGDAPTVCVHPAYRQALVPLRQGIAPLARRLEGTPFALRKLEQRPTTGGVSPDALPLDVNDLYATRYVQLAREQLVQRLVSEACTSRPPNAGAAERSLFYVELVQIWLLDGDVRSAHVPEGDGTKARDLFANRSEEQRTRWLKKHAAQIRSCTLTAASFR